MKRIITVSLCAIIILTMFGCNNKRSIKNDKSEQIHTASALFFSLTDKIALGGATRYCKNKIAPPTTLFGIEFETFEFGGDTIYSPLDLVSEEKYESILKKLEDIYGPPSYKKNYKVEWVSNDDSFSLTVAFDPDIHNQMAMRYNID